MRLGFVALISIFVACTPAPPPPAPPPQPPAEAPPPPPPAATPPVAEANPSDPPPAETNHPVRGDGEQCFGNAECASGACEGLGCDQVHPGTCARTKRICTRDRRPYCGCDGKTFFSSSTCPGARYSAKGQCP
ncbi:MAG: hypothetical protein QM831_44535 [Kofleriaceae bacterium]